MGESIRVLRRGASWWSHFGLRRAFEMAGSGAAWCAQTKAKRGGWVVGAGGLRHAAWMSLCLAMVFR